MTRALLIATILLLVAVLVSLWWKRQPPVEPPRSPAALQAGLQAAPVQPQPQPPLAQPPTHIPMVVPANVGAYAPGWGPAPVAPRVPGPGELLRSPLDPNSHGPLLANPHPRVQWWPGSLQGLMSLGRTAASIALPAGKQALESIRSGLTREMPHSPPGDEPEDGEQ
jgi:hypothetical protein